MKCSDGTLYTGVTNNLERRLHEHQEGYKETSYTHNKRPVELAYYKEFNGPLKAIAFEKQLKRWTREKKDALIAGDINKLKGLASCKNISSHNNYPFGAETRLNLIHV